MIVFRLNAVATLVVQAALLVLVVRTGRRSVSEDQAVAAMLEVALSPSAALVVSLPRGTCSWASLCGADLISGVARPRPRTDRRLLRRSNPNPAQVRKPLFPTWTGLPTGSAAVLSEGLEPGLRLWLTCARAGPLRASNACRQRRSSSR